MFLLLQKNTLAVFLSDCVKRFLQCGEVSEHTHIITPLVEKVVVNPKAIYIWLSKYFSP